MQKHFFAHKNKSCPHPVFFVILMAVDFKKTTKAVL
tara:strand:+ start:242 stop:349 length:108 start_codon:yes stop_codon:yes gene_type:complete